MVQAERDAQKIVQKGMLLYRYIRMWELTNSQLENVCLTAADTDDVCLDTYTDADRTKRVKEARDEAKKEIDSYKKSKDEEFKKFESEVYTSLFVAHAPHSPHHIPPWTSLYITAQYGTITWS